MSNNEAEDLIKIVKSLEDFGLLLKGQKCGFLSMLLGTLGASLLGNRLTQKGVKRPKYLTIQAKIPWKRSIKSS